MTLIVPAWPVPNTIHAFTTTRRFSGKSVGAFAECNLGMHLDEPSEITLYNRQQLLNLPHAPECIQWLQQVHGNHVHRVLAANLPFQQSVAADASITNIKNRALAILTADCIPILLYAPFSQEIAAIHAGWKGLATEVIANTVAQLSSQKEVIAWIGPHISQAHYEINASLREVFIEQNKDYVNAFYPSLRPQHFLFDLNYIARHQLKACGVHAIFHTSHCTYQEESLFYSYRRDGNNTGRIATLIWISQQ